MITMKRLCIIENLSFSETRLEQRESGWDFLHSFLDKHKRRNCI